jgi:hypothetical protein
MHASGRAALAVVAFSVVASNCGWILGLDEFVDAPPPTGGQGGAGGGCEAGAPVACYDGPEGTEGIGLCVAGTATCGDDGTPSGACEGQVTPATETCANLADEDCDGHDCVIWAKTFGDVSDQRVGGMAVDGDGNIYLAGSFNGTLAFDPRVPISANGSDIYVAKFNAEGEHIWSRSFGSPSGTVSLSGIAVDPDGNIVITGNMAGTIDFDGTVLSLSAYQDVYVAKLSPEGSALWATKPVSDDMNIAANPAIDSLGNIILFGTSECATCAPATTQTWVKKLKPDSSTSWYKGFPFVDGLGNQIAGSVSVDRFDNILITGAFSQTASFGSSSLTPAGGFDIFIAKLDPTGAHVWSARYGDGSDQQGMGIAADSLGNVIISGKFKGTLSFGGDEMVAAGDTDSYVAKLSSAKVYIWSKSFGGQEADEAGPIAVLPDGAIVFSGASVGSVNYGGGALRGGGGTDIPLVKLAPDGRHLWSRVFGGDLDQKGRALVITEAGETLLGSEVSGEVDVGSGVLPAGGGLDVLLAKFAP